MSDAEGVGVGAAPVESVQAREASSNAPSAAPTARVVVLAPTLISGSIISEPLLPAGRSIPHHKEPGHPQDYPGKGHRAEADAGRGFLVLRAVHLGRWSNRNYLLRVETGVSAGSEVDGIGISTGSPVDPL